jgi:hypothetical protein
MPRLNSIRRVVNREAFRPLTALLNGLIGAATGSNVTATHKRVEAIQNGSGPVNYGGVRSIETVTDINRNTAAADVTALKDFLYDIETAPDPYPANGNGLNQKQF